MVLSTRMVRLHSVYRNLTLWNSSRAKFRETCLDRLRNFSSSKILAEENKINIVLIHRGQKIPLTAKENDSILDIVLKNKIDIQGYGACDGCLSCSTCHITVQQADYDRLSIKTVEEDDMLALTKNLTDTSRLGCQIRLTKEMDGIEIHIPDVILDIRERITPEVDVAAA